MLYNGVAISHMRLCTCKFKLSELTNLAQLKISSSGILAVFQGLTSHM